MKTKIELEKDITNITTLIAGKFPELTKYILEMPESNSESEEVTLKNLADYHRSLEEIIARYSNTHHGKEVEKSTKEEALPGYPPYPASEDIYSKSKQEKQLNPENLSKKKTANQEEHTLNQKSFREDMSGADLDVPGSELDDQQENIGSEDEENNYYSLGGDNHDN
jgi:hypothetical protein